jgi:hypothetical protein
MGAVIVDSWPFFVASLRLFGTYIVATSVRHSFPACCSAAPFDRLACRACSTPERRNQDRAWGKVHNEGRRPGVFLELMPRVELSR